MPIQKFRLTISTGDVSGAGTDGDVYFGFCGREFYVDSSANDFERGATKTYQFGDGANVLFPKFNDPRAPQLEQIDLDKFPVYIRFVGRSREDNWNLQRVDILCDDVPIPLYERIFPEGGGIWMGTHATSIIHLMKHVDSPIP
jgi:hypothetical protein